MRTNYKESEEFFWCLRRRQGYNSKILQESNKNFERPKNKTRFCKETDTNELQKDHDKMRTIRFKRITKYYKATDENFDLWQKQSLLKIVPPKDRGKWSFIQSSYLETRVIFVIISSANLIFLHARSQTGFSIYIIDPLLRLKL